jgi:hypothetical protein
MFSFQNIKNTIKYMALILGEMPWDQAVSDVLAMFCPNLCNPQDVWKRSSWNSLYDEGTTGDSSWASANTGLSTWRKNEEYLKCGLTYWVEYS